MRQPHDRAVGTGTPVGAREAGARTSEAGCHPREGGARTSEAGCHPREGAAAPPEGGDASLSSLQHLVLRLLMAAIWLVARVPERLSYPVAGLAGVTIYLLDSRRRATARSNLARICAWLDRQGVASPSVHAAARDSRRLEAMVRDAFRHWMVSYLESATALRYDAGALRARVEIVQPNVVERALRPIPAGTGGRIFVSLHFGATELAGLYASRLSALPLTAPMEIVQGRLAAAYFERLRARFGVAVVPVHGAAGSLRRALARGEAIGLVADRNISADGSPVELFGAPARLPAGPAVLAAQTGAPLFFLALRRTKPGHWRARVVEPEVPAGATRREAARILLQQQARAFESFVADAPEQWWTVLFPIWEDDGRRAGT